MPNNDKELKTLMDVWNSLQFMRRYKTIEEDVAHGLGQEELADKLVNTAIDWIKELENGYCFSHEDYHLKEWSDNIECKCFNEGVKWCLERFFNLEE